MTTRIVSARAAGTATQRATATAVNQRMGAPFPCRTIPLQLPDLKLASPKSLQASKWHAAGRWTIAFQVAGGEPFHAPQTRSQIDRRGAGGVVTCTGLALARPGGRRRRVLSREPG